MSPRVPPELDAIVDRVFQHEPNRDSSDIPDQRVANWSVPTSALLEDGEKRLDAEHYNPEVQAALASTGLKYVPLIDLADLSLPGRFPTRVMADDADHGRPYLAPSDLLNLYASAGTTGATIRYLSYSTQTDLEKLTIRKGWLLMTCSGTIGRSYYVPARLDGWVATHDLIRIKPKKRGTAGYLLAWFNNKVAQVQLAGFTHGGQIDHITDKQVAGLMVPNLPLDKCREINSRVIRAVNLREKSLDMLSESSRMFF